MIVYFRELHNIQEHYALHTITVPNVNEPKHYRTGQSLDAFVRREGHPDYSTRKRWFYLRTQQDHDQDLAAASRLWMKHRIPSYPDPYRHFVHDSLGDFYKHIGYNPKTKKMESVPDKLPTNPLLSNTHNSHIRDNYALL
ncbi:hypothetical protein UFOVP75_228 [uncultured Caudovirales phage]|uniref:Uncharacterized protein n=1 Tax=uncultured Caudovirales phage TaxID=2100421 RepID=A0A6J5KZK5_9CAUD|nr:hypothetical protein UFOVP75_228 [uncultured Caudovirales phage]